ARCARCRLLARFSLRRALALPSRSSFFFIFTATSEIYTLSLHDALPIYAADLLGWSDETAMAIAVELDQELAAGKMDASSWSSRSEEHTSELQSRVDLVCRLLLEKKKQ